jgi:methylenetetrahydrofolate reductase (NADPH)
MTWTLQATPTQDRRPLRPLLTRASVEVVASDQQALSQLRLLPAGTEVFIANLPREGPDRLVEAAVAVRRAGLVPVPHVVARNIASDALPLLLRRLVTQAQVDRALVLGGDGPESGASYRDALQLIRSGALEEAGLRTAFVGCYPEGHPRIPSETLWTALAEKVAACKEHRLHVELVSQFCFDPVAILGWARTLRASGLKAPYRVGVAGPASRTRLLRYAMLCGVGPSLRMLSGREGLAWNMLATETPERLLRALEDSVYALGISGAHLFTFGDLESSAGWLKEQA